MGNRRENCLFKKVKIKTWKPLSCHWRSLVFQLCPWDNCVRGWIGFARFGVPAQIPFRPPGNSVTLFAPWLFFFRSSHPAIISSVINSFSLPNSSLPNSPLKSSSTGQEFSLSCCISPAHTISNPWPCMNPSAPEEHTRSLESGRRSILA